MRQRLLSHRWLIMIVIVALFARLYRFQNPVADWHSFRQADTASVTREFVKHGINLWVPRYQDHSNIQSGKDNPEGYRMVEFPIINGLIALFVKFAGLPLVATSRAFSIIASLGTIISLYVFVKQISKERTALATAAVLAVLPYSIFYSRVILPEPFMLFFLCLSLMSFNFWLQKKQIAWYFLAVISLALAVLLKPFVLFLAPVFIILALLKFKEKSILQPLLWLFPILVIAPFLEWRNWIKQYPAGIPASDWLFNSNGIRLRPAWFRWLFWERLTKMFLGYVGIFFLPLNFFKITKELWVYGAWWLGSLSYLIVMATGNVQHDYYQNLLLPIVAISVGRGVIILYDFLLQRKLTSISSTFIIAILVSSSWLLAWQQVKGFFNVNHWEYVAAGTAVDQLTPPDAKVIAPAFGDTHFLFQTNRTGWPIGWEIPDKISKGAQYYITTSKDDEANELKKQYTTVSETELYLLLNLTQPLTATAAATP